MSVNATASAAGFLVALLLLAGIMVVVAVVLGARRKDTAAHRSGVLKRVVIGGGLILLVGGPLVLFLSYFSVHSTRHAEMRALERHLQAVQHAEVKRTVELQRLAERRDGGAGTATGVGERIRERSLPRVQPPASKEQIPAAGTSRPAPGGERRAPPDGAAAAGPVLLAFHPRDDRADWLKDNALADESGARPRPPWVESDAGAVRWVEVGGPVSLASYRPGKDGRIAGYSRYAPTAAEARAEALAAARDKLAALVVYELRDDARGRSASWFGDVLPIARLVVSERVGTLVQDEHAETIERPYGTVYRHAVLVDAAPAVVAAAGVELDERLVAGAVEKLRFRRRVASTLASAFCVALVVLLVYSFLNAGTKGHFAWPLRILSVLALGLLFLGILYWKGWLSV